MVFYWKEIGEENITKSFQDNILTKLGITAPYSGKVKVWQGKAGILFGYKPFYLVVQHNTNGIEGRVDLHYLGNPKRILSTKRETEEEIKLIKSSLKEILTNIGVPEKDFLDSLEILSSLEENVKSLFKLLKSETASL